MDSKKQQDETQPQVSQQPTFVSDEIDLLDILKILIQQKWLILGITVLCTTLAIGVAILLPKEYMAKLVIRPPSVDSVEKLNIVNVDSNEAEGYFFRIGSQELYQELIDNLRSNQLRRKFFKENDLFRFLSQKEDNKSEDAIFEYSFNKKLVVDIGKKKAKGNIKFVTIILKGEDPAQIADWLNNFVSFADKETIMAQTVASSLKVQLEKENLLQRIESLRSMGRKRRLDKIAQLEEAILVADKLGWVEQYSNLGIQYEQAKMGTLNMSFSLHNVPLYFRGSKALQAEIDVLKQRKNDDPFIPELGSLLNQLNFLSLLKQGTDNVHAMTLDRAAIADDRPIKPKKKNIVVLGFMLGLLLSVCVAFIRNMILTAKPSRVEQ